MKQFVDYYKAFISYIKGKDNCPDFKTCHFTFNQKGVVKVLNDIKEVEKEFNYLLDNGFSWINIVCEKIVGECLFVTFEFSKTHHPEFVGKTDIKLCGPREDLDGKIMWNPNLKGTQG